MIVAHGNIFTHEMDNTFLVQFSQHEFPEPISSDLNVVRSSHRNESTNQSYIFFQHLILSLCIVKIV